MANNWRETRRRQAYELKRQGWKQRDIAVAMGVTEAAVSQWVARAEAAGVDGLVTRPRTGRPCRLSESQMHMLPEHLSHGAEAYGFRGEVWTCARVGKVIEWETGITYDRSQVSRLLKQVGWTPQRPVARARQRNEDNISRWRQEVWIELKKRQDLSIECLFLSMNQGFICCPVSFEPTPHKVKHHCSEFITHVIIYQ